MDNDVVGVTNELQVSHFGFSALSLVDTIHNVMVEEWESVVKEEFETSLRNMKLDDKMKLCSFPFTDNTTKEMFQLLQRFYVTKLFRISPAVTLPEFKKMQAATVEMENSDNIYIDTAKMEKLFEEKLEKIRQIRMACAKRDIDLIELEGSINVIRTLERAYEELLNMKVDKPYSPIRDSPV